MTIWVIIRVNHCDKINGKYVGPYTVIKSFKEFDGANNHVGELMDSWRVKHRKIVFHYEIVGTELG